jgi:t-SNARE complex subunit (syntaxin)
MKTLDLHDLLQQKLNAFTEFLSATIALQELSGSENDLKRINSLINNRQDCINIIDRIDDEINRLRKENRAFISTLPREERERIKVIAEKLDDTTSKAAHVNSKLKKMIRFKHDDIKNQLLKMRHTWRGIQGYSGKGHKTHEPRFLDVRL